jgi:prepilin-type N-terminal cleavage/methylation domain-containing protein
MMKAAVSSHPHSNAQAGFTLVEILVAIGLLAVVMTAIFNLYLGTERSADTQDRIADVQQNIRFALDQVVRDIRMAGFAVPVTTAAISSGPPNPTVADPFTMRTASTSDKVLRVRADFTSPAAAGTVQTITIDSDEMAALFAANDAVRIIRPDTQTERLEALFTVEETPTGAAIKLRGFSAATEYMEGDLIVTSSAGAPNPQTISYWLENGEIRRSANGGAARIIGQGVSGFQLSYLLGREDEITGTVPTASLDDIRAVRVTITGQANTREGVKTRTVSSVVQLRNRTF